MHERWKWEQWPYPSRKYWDYWYHTAEADRVARGVLARWDFNQALFDYLGLRLEDALTSSNVVIRALAMLDRRLGRRRFEKLRKQPDDHPLVRGFYELRGEADKWTTTAGEAAP